jgi:murein tripeptide amidase MpaA
VSRESSTLKAFLKLNLDFRKVDEEYEVHRLLSQRKAETISFDRYYRHAEINKYLDSLGSDFPSQVKVENVGKSYEGRDIKVVTISNGDGRSKNSIFIDAGIHAREWIAPATALYFISELVDAQSNFSRLLNELDFVIQPVVNPDGI